MPDAFFPIFLICKCNLIHSGLLIMYFRLYKGVNAQKGLYSQCNRDIIIYILSLKVLRMKLKCKGKVTVYHGLVAPCIISQ